MTLLIEVSKHGVNKVRASSDSVSGSIELAELLRATALPIWLLDTAVIEHFGGDTQEEASPGTEQ